MEEAPRRSEAFTSFTSFTLIFFKSVESIPWLILPPFCLRTAAGRTQRLLQCVLDSLGHLKGEKDEYIIF